MAHSNAPGNSVQQRTAGPQTAWNRVWRKASYPQTFSAASSPDPGPSMVPVSRPSPGPGSSLVLVPGLCPSLIPISRPTPGPGLYLVLARLRSRSSLVPARLWSLVPARLRSRSSLVPIFGRSPQAVIWGARQAAGGHSSCSGATAGAGCSFLSAMAGARGQEAGIEKGRRRPARLRTVPATPSAERGEGTGEGRGGPEAATCIAPLLERGSGCRAAELLRGLGRFSNKSTAPTSKPGSKPKGV